MLCFQDERQCATNNVINKACRYRLAAGEFGEVQYLLKESAEACSVLVDCARLSLSKATVSP